MYICNRFEWLKETVEKKITTFATTNTIAVLLSIRKAIGNVHEIEIQENARKERRREVEENYKAIWKDFPLFPFSFNRTIISFVIKYHLSSRLLFSAQVCVWEREGESSWTGWRQEGEGARGRTIAKCVYSCRSCVLFSLHSCCWYAANVTLLALTECFMFPHSGKYDSRFTLYSAISFHLRFLSLSLSRSQISLLR